MRVLNADQMREADRRTIEEIGIPPLVLMENAGRQVVAALQAAYADLEHRRVAVLCGRGNNGGDGFVAARVLSQRGVRVSVFVLSRLADVRGNPRSNLDVLERLGVGIVEIPDGQAWALHAPEVERASLIVDAIFGTGLSAPLGGFVQSVVADLNSWSIPIAAIDLPSGLSADSSEPIGDSIIADLTVTLAAPKYPLVTGSGTARAGRLVVADIGIPRAVIESLRGPQVSLLTRETVRAMVTPRAEDTHKGEYGRILVVAGSTGKTGAAYLAASGALRSGAGLVTVATPAGCQAIVAAMRPEYMTEPLRETNEGIDPDEMWRVLRTAGDVIAIGPGLGRGPATKDFVVRLVGRAAVPLVIDADGLNAFAAEPARLAGREGRDVIITPHPGEMGRLLGTSADDVQARRVDAARDFAVHHHVYVVLKGHRTVIATPDAKVFINPTGNPGMASGGTGDVLTGTIAAWMGQLRNAEAACKLAVYLHGLAGDLSRTEEGEAATTAVDLLGHLGVAMQALTSPPKPGNFGRDRDICVQL
jgi:NAD(P)H-hydrate epimerase